MRNLSYFLLAFAVIIQLSGCKQEKPVDKMEWWKEAKFGMFIHWGLYSVPAGEYKGNEIGGIGEWIMNNGKIPVNEYAQYATQFNPTDFNADDWVKMAKDAGMKYIVITSKHHDGFAMFNSKVSNYDIMDATPFKRDIIKEMADACKKQGMAFGLYYSQAQDWHFPGGAANGGHWDSLQNGEMDKYLDEIAVPQVTEILNNYGDIKVLWWDTPTDMTPERAAKFMPELAKHPNLIYNNRLGGGIDGDLETPEQYIPATGIPGKNWESCMTMNDTWGFKKNDHNWKSSEMLVRNLIDIASKGGNYLLNVGPTSLGIIPSPSVERLKEIGSWMKTNGEAIYGTTASPFKKLEWGRCTVKKEGNKNLLYLHVFDIPADGILWVPGLASNVKKAYPLKNKMKKLQVEKEGNNLKINVSGVEKDQFATVIVLETNEEVIVYNGPEIKADFTIFIDKADFTIVTDIPNTVIHYTTDGSVPTNESPIAQGVNTVSAEGSFSVKAMCFADRKPISGLVEKKFIKEDPIAAVDNKNCLPGLRYSYFEGKWKTLPDFSTIKPISTGTARQIDLSMKKRDSDYGLIFNGYIQVPQTGVYQLALTSDDGSKMTIAGKTLLNDGLHAMETKTVDIALSSGFHPVEIQFFQSGGGDGLKLEWKTAGKEYSQIDLKQLSYKK
jgi:alpha-L-fucosidase